MNRRRTLVASLLAVTALAACGEPTPAADSPPVSSFAYTGQSDTTRATAPITTTTTEDRQWANDASDVTDEIVLWTTRLSDDADALDLAAVMTDCQGALDDSGEWRSVALAVPYADVREPFVAAVDEFVTAFDLCSYGQIEESTGHILRANDLIVQATGALDAYL